MLRVPDDFVLTECDLFARQFYLGSNIKPYGHYRELTFERYNDPLLGYHERINQIEQFLLERRFWCSDYPQELAQIAAGLTKLGRSVIRGVLKLTDIPKEQWSLATGGCSEGEGSYHFTFNHYRPSLPGIGLSSHKDDGFVTILRTTSPGLEINRNDRWESVTVDKSYFIVNFGISMEVLTHKSKQPVAAIMHRVRHQKEDRFSFGHFSSSFCKCDSSAGIYSYVSGHGLRRVCSSRELIDANDEEIYLGTKNPEELPL